MHWLKEHFRLNFLHEKDKGNELDVEVFHSRAKTPRRLAAGRRSETLEIRPDDIRSHSPPKHHRPSPLLALSLPDCSQTFPSESAASCRRRVPTHQSNAQFLVIQIQYDDCLGIHPL